MKAAAWNFRGVVCGRHADGSTDRDFLLRMESSGLPFVPFDTFDRLTRVLPGRFIAFGIGTMVALIRGLHLGPTSAAAKMAEQAMAIVGLFIVGVVGGGVLFAILHARRKGYGITLGLALGFILWHSNEISS